MVVCGQLHTPDASPEKEPQYPLDRMLSRPQSQCTYCRKEKNLLPLSGIEAQFIGHPTCSQ
jgi:hypothetical protein